MGLLMQICENSITRYVQSAAGQMAQPSNCRYPELRPRSGSSFETPPPSGSLDHRPLRPVLGPLLLWPRQDSVKEIAARASEAYTISQSSALIPAALVISFIGDAHFQ
jgi:hypothetical protein